MDRLDRNVFGLRVFVVKLADGYFCPGAPSTPYVNLAAIHSEDQARFLAKQMGGVVVPCRSLILTEEDAIGVLPFQSETQSEPIQKPAEEEASVPEPAVPARTRRRS